MTPEVRRVLDVVEDLLIRGTPDSEDLAAILSALRGPDKDDDSRKHETTSRIRAQAFPRIAERLKKNLPFANNWYFNDDGQPVKVAELSNQFNHFEDHILGAVKALNR